MSSLTIDELKKALTKSGVLLPNGKVKKEQYVKLYEENIASVNVSLADAYSSDEDNSQGSKKVTSTNSLSDSQNIPEAVNNLSDVELYENLQNLGYNAGPVLPNTRAVYVKKLVQLLLGEGDVSHTNGGNPPVPVNEANISDNELTIEPDLPLKQSKRENITRRSPSPGTSKQNRANISEAIKPEQRPVSRVSYIERVPRQRVLQRSDTQGQNLHETSSEGYIGRWSPKVSLSQAPGNKEKTTSKNSLLIYAGLFIVFAVLMAALYYQWNVNDPYQQLQEDAENEVKKLAAQKAQT